jgi:iron(III) transport system ATP-binding protein
VSTLSPPLLRVERVSHAFGPQCVLDAVDLALGAGEIAALLGPSGCGKTTLLRLVAGFEALQHGTIHLNGRVVSDAGHRVPPERRQLGMVFQDFALFPHLTVAGNIAFGLGAMARADRAVRVDALLDLVGLPGAGSRYPHELSGGQQQRVALARALAPRPPLVLLDEPFSSLDVGLREQLAAEVRDVLRHEGAGAILVTHDQHEAFAFADRVGVMDAGRLAQWDTPFALFHHPATRFVAGFVGEGTFVRGIAGPDGVRTALGIAACDASPRHGAVDVLVRPEDLVVDAAAPCRGRLTARRFRGAVQLFTVELPGGEPVLVNVPADQVTPIGQEIGLRLATMQLNVFTV